MQNRNYPAKRREKIRLVLMICFTGVLILATVKLTVVALRQIQRTTGVVTPGHGWLFVQDSLRREPLSDMKTGKINPQNLEETDLLVNQYSSRFADNSSWHFSVQDRYNHPFRSARSTGKGSRCARHADPQGRSWFESIL